MNTRAYVRGLKSRASLRSAISFKRRQSDTDDHRLHNFIHSSPLKRDVSFVLEAAKEN